MPEILNPKKAAENYKQGKIPGALPKAVRKFGYFPDIGQLKSGDLLLFSAVNPPWASRKIVEWQSKNYDDSHSMWTHAAIYIFDGVIIEALPFRGVVESHISKYIPNHLIKARRHSEIDEYRRYHVSFNAMKRRGRFYSVHKIPSVAMATLNVNLLLTGTDKKYTICSQVFYDSFLEATNLSLEDCPPGGPILPAQLSLSSSLSSIDWNWLKMNSEPTT